MIPLYEPAAVRAMDARAFERGVSTAELMERAAGHLARAVLAVAGRGYGLRVAILAGKGNNGGDGIAAGRRLLDAGAWPVVCLVADPGEDGAAQLARYRAAGGRLAGTVGQALADADVAVDCLLGTGARGEPRSPYREAVEALNAYGAGPVVACDLPSGVDAGSGQVPGTAVRADLTVTLGAHKLGLHLWPARGYCGELVVGELGIVELDDRPAASVLEPAEVRSLVPPPSAAAHKRARGVVVVLAGSAGMGGAATMVARGAMAAGAGLVTVATSPAVRAQVAASVPEALTLEVPDDDPDGAFERLAAEAERADALAVGPGLGHSEPTVSLIRRVVRELDVALVLDADGVNAFRRDGDALAAHAAPLLVLTPHERELARVAGDDEVWPRRAELLPDRAAAWNAVVVAKGPGTMVVAPDGRVWVNPAASGALSSGGTGDVLTGMASTLVAQRPEPESAAAAVYLHGIAGEAAAERRAARSVTALDVAAAVPAALRRVGAAR